MWDDIRDELHSEAVIREKVRELGGRIAEDHPEGQLIVVGILKGGAVFIADLIRAIDIPVTLHFMSISNYSGATEAFGAVRIVKDLHLSITGRHARLGESIVDTGLTLRYLIDNLLARKPASLKVCSLLDKPARRIVEVPIDYKGFEVPDEYLVGYGLAYKQLYRNLPGICVLKEEVRRSSA